MDDSIHLERRPAFAAWFFLLVAAVLLGLGIVWQQMDLLIGAVLPLLLMVFFWLSHPTEKTLHFGTDSLFDEHQQELIPYEEIVGLTIANRTPLASETRFPAGRLAIIGRERCLEFPLLKRESARRLYRNLLSRIPVTGSREINPELQTRLTNDLQLFEPDLVFSFRARRHVPSAAQRDANWFLTTLVLASLFWIVMGILLGNFWLVAGICTGCVTLLGWLVMLSLQRNHYAQIPNPERSGLIVSPRGIALIQGHLKGELKWTEVKSLYCERAPSGAFVIRHPMRSILINVPGVQILLADIYDRPLATIFDCMQRYWETR